MYRKKSKNILIPTRGPDDRRYLHLCRINSEKMPIQRKTIWRRVLLRALQAKHPTMMENYGFPVRNYDNYVGTKRI